jgi:Sec-independent protein translocase protein TatA
MRGVGKGVRSFKDGMNDITDVESSDQKEQKKEKEQNSTEK